MRTAIASICAYLAEDKGYSHEPGCVRIFKDQLKDDGVDADIIITRDERSWDDYDQIYLWQGLAMNGVLKPNIYSTLRVIYARKLAQLAKFHGDLKTIWYPLLSYGPIIREKNWDWTDDHGTNAKRILDEDNIANRIDKSHAISQCRTIVNPNPSSHICIGDSHMPSAWQRGTHIRVHSGMTMHSASVHLGNLFIDPKWYTSVTFYFGNIDVRHHLCRNLDGLDPIEERVGDLLYRYEEAVRRVLALGISVELVDVLPIEAESRQIPQPGWYKGKPFHGTHLERTTAATLINAGLHNMVVGLTRQGFDAKMYHHPKCWNSHGFLDQQFMERPRSVHIAPNHYRAFRTY